MTAASVHLLQHNNESRLRGLTLEATMADAIDLIINATADYFSYVGPN